MKLLSVIFAGILFSLLTVGSAFAQTFPSPTGYVNDYAKVFSPVFTTRLENTLKAFEGSSSAEVVVVTVPTLQDITIDDYAVRLFEAWKIGKDKKDNGVLILIAKNEREVRIEVGYGLESSIPDARAGRIIRDDMVPYFKEGNYEAGTENGVSTILSYIRGEPISESAPLRNTKWDFVGEFFPFLIFGVMYLGSFLARSKEYYAGGVIGGVVGLLIGILIGSMFIIVGSTILLAIIGLVLDFILSRNYQSLKQQHKSTDWWGSRGGFYGGGSSSSGGGFGGFGGGSSGGGGASGRW